MVSPFHRVFDVAYRTARKIVVGVIGGTLLVLGIVMLVAPGPGLIGIAVALALLASEFVWARVWLKRVRDRADRQLRFRRRLVWLRRWWRGPRRRPTRLVSSPSG